MKLFKGSNKLDCDKIQDMLSPYLDGELNSEDRQFVESHLKTCESCRKEFASLQQTSKLIKQLPEIKPMRPIIITSAEKIRSKTLVRALSRSTASVGVLVFLFAGYVVFSDFFIHESAVTPNGVNAWRMIGIGIGFGVFVILLSLTIFFRRKRGK